MCEKHSLLADDKTESERIDFRTFYSTGDIVRHPDNIHTQFQHLTLLNTPLVESPDQSSHKTMANPNYRNDPYGSRSC